MGRTVKELLATLDADELTYWIAARKMGVLDDDKALRDVVDHAGANVCATLVNLNRARGSDPVSVADFLLFSERPEREDLPPEEVANKMRLVMGGRVKRQNDVT